MNVSQTPGAIKKFGRTPWKFQSTFQTPLRQLDSFVSTILSANEALESASVTVDGYVFEPKHLNALLNGKEGAQIGRDITLNVESRDAASELLTAAFSDWVDFVFIPMPKPFVIYADHDEYATFFANNKSNLSLIVAPLLKQGFKEVLNYQRHF